MAFNYYLYSAGAYRDISEFVVNVSLIPFIDRNRDFSLRSNPIKFDLFDTSTYIPAPGDKFKAEYSGTVVFIGKVRKAKHIHAQSIYKIEVLNRISDLQKHLVDFDTLQADLIKNARVTADDKVNLDGNTSFVTTRTYWAGDSGNPDLLDVYLFNTLDAAYLVDTISVTAHGYSNGDQILFYSSGGTDYVSRVNKDLYNGGDNETLALVKNYQNVKIEYLIQRMFILAGFTLTSNLASATIGTFNKSGSNRVYTGDDFRQDIPALYSAGQASARDSGFPTGTLGISLASKITFFDYISTVYKSMSAFLVASGDDAFTCYHAPTQGEVYTISNDDSYSYVDTDITAEYTDYSFDINYGFDPTDYRSAYHSTTAITPYQALKQGDGANQISWYSNLAFLFEDKDGSTGDVEPDDFWDVTSLGVSGSNTRFTRHMLTNYTEEEIETNVTLTIKGVVENYLDPDPVEEASHILQEVYT